MKRIRRNNSSRGFTLLELLLVFAIIAILAALLLPTLQQAQARSRRIECLSQLKQIGVGIHMFAHEHDNKFPWAVLTNAGGSGGLGLPADFQVLSNELISPKLLACPSDKERKPAAHFGELDLKHISYALYYKVIHDTFNCEFLQTDTPDEPLASDRNISKTHGKFHWYGSGIHQGSGNILFVDGHVETIEGGRLDSVFRNPRARTALVLPEAKGSAPSGTSASTSQAGGTPSLSPRSGTAAGTSSASGFSALQTFFDSKGTPSTGGSSHSSAGGGSTAAPVSPYTRTIDPVPPSVEAPSAKPATSVDTRKPDDRRLPATNVVPEQATPSTPTNAPPVAPGQPAPESLDRSFNWLLAALLLLVASVLCGVILERRRRVRWK